MFVEHADEAGVAALVGAGRSTVGISGGEEEHVAVLDEGPVMVADHVTHQQLIDPVGESAGVEAILQSAASVVESGSHGVLPGGRPAPDPVSVPTFSMALGEDAVEITGATVVQNRAHKASLN